MLIFKNRNQVSKQQLTNISKECQKWTRLKSQEGKNTNVRGLCVTITVWPLTALCDVWWPLHCVTTKCRPLCNDHFFTNKVMTTIWRPLCQNQSDNHCVKTPVPLCHDQCVTTNLSQPLCYNHCVTTTVWQDCFALNYRMTFVDKMTTTDNRRKWLAYE